MLEFVTKTPKSVKMAKLVEDQLKINTVNGNINLSKSIVSALKGEEASEEDPLEVGMAFDGEKGEAYIYAAEDGLKASGKNQSTIRSAHHSGRTVEVFKLEELQGKVLVFDVDLEDPKEHTLADGTVLKLFKLSYSKFSEPRITKPRTATTEEAVAAPSVPAVVEEEAQIPVPQAAGPAPGITHAAPAHVEGTTIAEEEGLTSTTAEEVMGNVPPAPNPGGMQWPSDN